MKISALRDPHFAIEMDLPGIEAAKTLLRLQARFLAMYGCECQLHLLRSMSVGKEWTSYMAC